MLELVNGCSSKGNVPGISAALQEAFLKLVAIDAHVGAVRMTFCHRPARRWPCAATHEKSNLANQAAANISARYGLQANRTGTSLNDPDVFRLCM